MPALFGSDADDLNTHRWLHATKNKMRSQGAGIYANLMTFGHGNDFCIDMLYLQFTLIFCIQCCLKGWRFTIWETRAVLIDRLSNFEFTLDEKLQAWHTTSCMPLNIYVSQDWKRPQSIFLLSYFISTAKNRSENYTAFAQFFLNKRMLRIQFKIALSGKHKQPTGLLLFWMTSCLQSRTRNRQQLELLSCIRSELSGRA